MEGSSVFFFSYDKDSAARVVSETLLCSSDSPNFLVMVDSLYLFMYVGHCPLFAYNVFDMYEVSRVGCTPIFTFTFLV